ncbi:D-alanyl-D-alanine carboxypeptidase family protein [Cellulosimicrobium sp. NPDC057127]|uniref:M15 family metallopeptidase n=1 Tax=Cellulosimicrobium sp. NPDC057127 TaxID=3346026 RepID=UPI00362BE8B3
MGRHTASRPSVLTALDATARLGAGLAHRAAGSLTRRSLVGASAAVAAVALTASTATATLFDGAPTARSASSAAASPAATAFGTPVVTADPAVVDAASDELVRADFLTRESSAAIPGDKAAQIDKARAALETALANARSSAAATPAGGTGAGTDTGAGTTATDAAPQDAPAKDAAATTDEETAQALASRDGDRASRSTARTPLDELAAPLEDAPTLAAPLVALSAEDAEAAEAASAPADEDGEAPAADGSADSAGDAAEETTSDASAPAGVAPAPEAEANDEKIAALTTELRTLLDASEAQIAVEAAPPPPAPEVPAAAPAPPSPEEIAAQLDAWATSTEGFGNGQIPAEALCELSFAPGELLRCDADHQIEALNAKYREAFGTDLSVTDSYRSYESQVAVKASRGYFAAVPGTSNHGWALALDLGGGVEAYGTAQYEWMRANAPALGWDNPEWARAGGSKNEPWHWEFGDLS